MSGRNGESLTRETTAELSQASPQSGGPSQERARPEVTLNQIHCLAFRKWSAAGRPTGDTTRFWLEAEQDLVGGT